MDSVFPGFRESPHKYVEGGKYLTAPGAEKGVLREARILTALNATAVPHPHCYAACEDTGVIGAPFYVMELVDG